MKNIKYLIVGILFGIVFVKTEIVSWFRIQEMFRFHSFHMYGVISTAISVASLSIFLLKKTNAKTVEGDEIVIPKKHFRWGQIFGGLIFGLGWAITGACPGPLYAQIGAGFGVVLVTLFFAILGTYVYAQLRPYLPK